MTDAAGADRVVDALVAAGVETVVGLPGTQTLPLDVAVDDSPLSYLMARDESAIPHVAWGHYEAGGGLAATVTVPGPGDTQASHGLKNALNDCVPLVHLSADVPADARGFGAIHEIDPSTYDHVVRANHTVDRPAELPSAVADALCEATTPPYGPVRLGIASDVLAAPCPAPAVTAPDATPRVANDAALAEATDLLAAAERPLLYVGGGCRRSDVEAVRALAREVNLPVLASYKGKGVVPDDDPRTLGVAGSHTPASALAVVEEADLTVALGTDLDDVATGSGSLPLDPLVHVTLAPADLHTRYEPRLSVHGDAGEAARRLRDAAGTGGWDGASVGARADRAWEERLREGGFLDDRTPMPTAAALRAVRDALPRETPVTTDVGGFRLWAKQVFDAYEPTGYVTAGSWAGMGVGLPAAVGAAVGTGRQVACLTGDGGLLMSLGSLHVASEAELDLLCVVFDNADYGVISAADQLPPSGPRFDWTAPDFATVAEGMGWRGERVETVDELRDATCRATRTGGPVLVDAAVDPAEQTAAAVSSD
ncbi:MAG: thiamine pyrophosphate-binding protein [Haloferacaceae archaeon]